MSKPEFVYTTYIETTPEKLWQALTSSEFSKRYWFGTELSHGGASGGWRGRYDVAALLLPKKGALAQFDRGSECNSNVPRYDNFKGSRRRSAQDGWAET